MKKILPIVTTLFLLISAVFAKECCGHGERDFSPKHGMGHKMKLEMLDLSNEQREGLEASLVQTKKKIIPLKAEIELKRVDLESAMKADKPDRSTIMKLTKEISDLELKIKQARIDQMLKVHSILTPEQREQLKKPLPKVIKKKIIKKNFEEEHFD